MDRPDRTVEGDPCIYSFHLLRIELHAEATMAYRSVVRLIAQKEKDLSHFTGNLHSSEGDWLDRTVARYEEPAVDYVQASFCVLHCGEYPHGAGGVNVGYEMSYIITRLEQLKLFRQGDMIVDHTKSDWLWDYTNHGQEHPIHVEPVVDAPELRSHALMTQKYHGDRWTVLRSVEGPPVLERETYRTLGVVSHLGVEGPDGQEVHGVLSRAQIQGFTRPGEMIVDYRKMNHAEKEARAKKTKASRKSR